MNNIVSYMKVYKSEISRLSQAYSDKCSMRELIFLFPKWYKYLNNRSSPVQDELPWVTFSAIKFLKKTLTKEMIVYEFGSGGSTLCFAKRVKQVYSVEHDPEWFLAVSNAIQNRGYTNWSGRVIEPVYDNEYPEKSPSDPDAYISGSPDFRGYSFKNYVESIDDFSDEYFDLVLVDGRARPSCFKHAMAKIKEGGFSILDNAERVHYSYIYEDINNYNWMKYDFYGPGPYAPQFWKTCIWKKVR